MSEKALKPQEGLVCGHICMYVPKKLEQKVSNHITVLGRGSPHRQRSIRQKSSIRGN